MDDFPYFKNDLNIDELYKMFKNLNEYKPIFHKMNYNIYNIPSLTYLELCFLPEKSPVILLNEEGSYDKYNKISNYFTDECRVKAKRYDHELSPYEYWTKNKEEIKKRAIQKYGNISNHSLRETIYEVGSEATTFRPVNLTAMIIKFGATNILDFSAGWGDRLIAAMAANVEFYCGVDPNTCLHPKYKEIIDMFSSDKFGNFASKTKVHMIQSPFETAEIPSRKYDMIFTSPPYFNLEIYSDEPTQSTKYKEVDIWYDNFLIYSIKKAWNLLSLGGHMIIVINDIRDGPKYVQKMIQDINMFEDSLYLGVISYADVVTKNGFDKAISPQPMWIWKKITIEKNPPIIVEDFKFDDKIVHVVRDDLLPGGTKQRAWNIFNVMNIPENEVIYFGSPNGVGQVAIAISGKLAHKKVTIYTMMIKFKMSFRARMYGAKFIEMKNATPEFIRNKIEEYAKQNKAFVLPLGLDTKEFKNLLYKQLKDNFPQNLIKNPTKQTVWVTAGSATLASVLFDLFPENKFGIVQVGKKIWPDQMNERSTLYIAPEKFLEDTKILPPYPSMNNWDAKIWQFVLKYGKDGDIIWNPASDQNILETHFEKKGHGEKKKGEKINIEYNRWIINNHILTLLNQYGCDKKEKYEMINIFIEWLLSSISLCNSSPQSDPVYFPELVKNINHPINQKMINLIIEKRLTIKSVAINLVKSILKEINSIDNIGENVLEVKLESISENPEIKFGNSKSTSENPEIKLGDSKVKLGDSKSTSENPEIKFGDSKSISKNPEIKLGDSKSISENPEIKLGDSKVKFGDSKSTSENPEIKLENELKNMIISYKDFKKIISKKRFEILTGSLEDILIALLRYSSVSLIISRYQSPLQTFKRFVTDYKIGIEGISSPFNSQLILIDPNLKYCSLFDDTDKILGSMGNFFNLEFQNMNVVIEPPPIINILNSVADKCISECRKAKENNNKIKFFIRFILWKKSYAYQTLIKSEFLKYSEELSVGTYYCVDLNLGEIPKKIIPRFPSIFIVLGHNVDEDYKHALDDMKL